MLCKKLDGQGKELRQKRIILFFIVDIKVTKMNVEQDFVLVDILWIIFKILNLYKTLIRPVATYSAESRTLNKDIAKGFDTFKRKILTSMLGGITVNESLRKRYNKKFMQLCGDVDILSFVRISRLNWIGHVNRIDSKRKVIQIYNNNPQGSPVRG